MFSLRQPARPQEMKRGKSRVIAGIFLLLCLIVPLTACSQSSPSAQKPAATAKPARPAVPAGTVLYQADWSHGLAGWQGASGLQTDHNQLQITASDSASIAAPYQPTVSNYAVEVRIQIFHQFRRIGGGFIIFAKPAPKKDGFQAGVLRLQQGPHPNFDHPQTQIMIDPRSSMDGGAFLPHDYEPYDNWHTYRVEVQGNTANWFVDGTPSGSATSNVTNILSNGPIGISCDYVTLHVSDFRITAL